MWQGSKWIVSFVNSNLPCVVRILISWNCFSLHWCCRWSVLLWLWRYLWLTMMKRAMYHHQNSILYGLPKPVRNRLTNWLMDRLIYTSITKFYTFRFVGFQFYFAVGKHWSVRRRYLLHDGFPDAQWPERSTKTLDQRYRAVRHWQVFQ